MRIRHAEVLNPDGTLYTANLRGAKATDYYTFAGDGPETYEPSFTFHGFRYVEITGVDAAPAAERHRRRDRAPTATCTSELDTTSDRWSTSCRATSSGASAATSCRSRPTPRRATSGWAGPATSTSSPATAVYNMDSQAFLTKWLQDLRDTQRADGALPGVAPIVPGRFDGGYGPAGWVDAGVHVPWTLWQAYGDTSVIAEQLRLDEAVRRLPRRRRRPATSATPAATSTG